MYVLTSIITCSMHITGQARYAYIQYQYMYQYY